MRETTRLVEPTGGVVGGADGPRPRATTPRPRLTGWLEPALAVAIAGSTFLVHDVRYLLTQPYWLDETWVAASTRAPLQDLPLVTGSSPIGWTALLRLVAVGGPERHRLLPLVLLAATTALAYLIGRRAPLPAPVGGGLAAGAVLLLPHSLARTSLKQYTCDAFCALLLVWLALRAEESPRRRRLVPVAVAAPVALLFSDATLLVAGAMLVGLLAAALLRRQWHWARDVAVCALACSAGLGLVYVVAVRPHVIPSLTSYWQSLFLPVHEGFGPAWQLVASRLTENQQMTNLGPPWLAASIIAAGVLTLAVSGQLSLAVGFPALVLAMLAASALQRYPLWDGRTSFFFFIIVAVVAAFGAAGAARGVAALLERRSPRRRTVAVAGAALSVVVCAGAYVVAPVTEYVRRGAIPPEDTRDATAWIRGAHDQGRRPPRGWRRAVRVRLLHDDLHPHVHGIVGAGDRFRRRLRPSAPPGHGALDRRRHRFVDRAEGRGRAPADRTERSGLHPADP